MEGYMSGKNMQDTCILMGSFRTLDTEELVALHVLRLLFLPLDLPSSQANSRELKRMVFGIVRIMGLQEEWTM